MTAAELAQRLREMEQRFDELEKRMVSPQPRDDMQALLSEYGDLRPSVELWRDYCRALEMKEQAAELGREVQEGGDAPDAELRRMAQEEYEDWQQRAEQLWRDLKVKLRPGDDLAHRDAVLEVRAGTGGEEAALFGGALLRMYARYAVRKGWSWEPVRMSATEGGGCREATVLVGGGCYGLLRREGGVHRVQRVPATESQGRVHTSTCTVVTLPQVSEPDQVQIAPDDLRIDTFRASGAGGQHVNKTDSAVRLTHLPSGLVVECQEDRSQHRNRLHALAILQARLQDQTRQQQQDEQAQQRRDMVGSGSRAEKIRTYNFPQLRITDHRLGQSFHQLEEMLDGDLDPLLLALVAEEEQEE